MTITSKKLDIGRGGPLLNIDVKAESLEDSQKIILVPITSSENLKNRVLKSLWSKKSGSGTPKLRINYYSSVNSGDLISTHEIISGTDHDIIGTHYSVTLEETGGDTVVVNAVIEIS